MKNRIVYNPPGVLTVAARPDGMAPMTKRPAITFLGPNPVSLHSAGSSEVYNTLPRTVNKRPNDEPHQQRRT